MGIPSGPDGPIEIDESFCGRTPEVQDAILYYLEVLASLQQGVPIITDCADVTDEHLEMIQDLELTDQGIAELKNHDFAGLVNLEVLHLQGNELENPPVLSDLVALRELDISNNALLSPPDLSESGGGGGYNPPLEVLNLSNNPQMGDTEGGANLLSLRGLVELHTLNLTNTGLTETPNFADIADNDPNNPDFDIDPKLEEVYLSGNRLTAVPSAAAMRSLVELRVLHMNDNQLTGTMPNLVGNTRLEDLQLQNNRLSGIHGLGSNGALRTLYLHDNEFTSVPGSIENLAELVDVRMQNNLLTAFPALTAADANLETLLLNGNRLATAPSVSANTALTTLRLDDNELTAAPDVSANTALLYLSLSNNMLTAVPSLSANVELLELDVSGNLLTSAPDVSDNTNLLTLALSDNQMTGVADLSGHMALATLLLDDNRLTGLTLGATVALRTLHVHNNMLTTLPSMSSRLRLTVFSVYNNPLTALPSLSANTALREVWVGWHHPFSFDTHTLPANFLSGLPSGLTHLYVEGFALDASEMQTIGTRFAGLKQLHLGGTDLASGQVHGLLDLGPAGLTVLALDGIDLTGVTWSKLARLTALQTLDVTGANLDDTAATAIAANAPAGLQSLWMSYNGLTSVPSLARFGFLKSLHLEHNNIAESAVGGNAFSGPLHAGLVVRVTAGNPDITSSDAQLTSAHAGAIFETQENVVTSLSVAKRVVGTETTPGAEYGFNLNCVGPGNVARNHAFTRADGDTGYVPVHAPGVLTASVHPDFYRTMGDLRAVGCALSEPDDGGATSTTGLFSGSIDRGTGSTGSIFVEAVNTFGAGGPGVTIVTTPATDPPALTVAENAGTATYTVALATSLVSTSEVTVALARTGDWRAARLLTSTLTFTPDNWDTGQTVTLTIVDDDIDNAGDARELTITHTANGGVYVNVTAALAVTVTDDDTRGVTFDPAAVSVAPGGTATYTVVLDTEPTANVTFSPIGTSHTAVATVEPISLTFTTDNWAAPQTITVTGGVIGTTNVDFNIAGGDYAGIIPPSVLVTVAAASTTDYDVDDDNLIDIANLAQLDATRWDLAFPNAPAGMGCAATCAGYELTADLDFDTNDDGMTNVVGDDYWDGGEGWVPIVNYNTEFHGNGHTISNLFINRPSWERVGLFHALAGSSYAHHLGLLDANVTAGKRTGALVGELVAGGRVRAVYATGSVAGSGQYAGGLVGILFGSVEAAWANVSVSRTDSDGSHGGMVGVVAAGGSLQYAYSLGAVTSASGSTNVGGVYGVLFPAGTATDVYFDATTSGETLGGTSQTTAQLQAPTDYTGIYAAWNVDLDGDGTADDPWDFGTATDYPMLKAADAPSGRTEIWRATLTVGNSGDVWGFTPTFGALAPNTFSFNGTDYTVSTLSRGVYQGIGSVTFRPDATLGSGDFILSMGGIENTFDGDSFPGTPNQYSIQAGSSPGFTPLTFVDGDSVEVILYQVGAAITPPTATGSIPDITMATSTLRNVDVVSYFSGTVDSYSAMSADNTAVGATVTGSVIALTTFAIEATVTITVTATNTGGSATQMFDVTVREGICDRTQQVQDAILDAISDVDTTARS